MPVDHLVLAATSRDPALRPADAGEFVRAVRRVREDLGEQSGLTGVMGAGVQGLAEAPWLNLDTPAATNGWWAHSTAATPVSASGGWGNSDLTMPPANGSGQFAGSHTLVVHREQAAPYRRRREPFLQRWLFSPRLAIIALIVILGAGLGLGSWWFTSGRYTHVPSVTGDSVAAATTVLTSHGFKVTQGARLHSNTAPEGTVMGTSPSGRVAKGSRIALLISAGPFTSVVPKVEGGTAQRRRGRAEAGVPELPGAGGQARAPRPGPCWARPRPRARAAEGPSRWPSWSPRACRCRTSSG